MPAKGRLPMSISKLFSKRNTQGLSCGRIVHANILRPISHYGYAEFGRAKLVLFPYLKAQHPYMLAQSVASPFSGAAIPPPTQKTKTKTRVKARAAPAPLRMVVLQNGDLMGPNSARTFHPTSLGAYLEVPWQPVSAKKTPTRKSSASPTFYPKPTPVLLGIILERSRH
jgi:hypothetical protein